MLIRYTGKKTLPYILQTPIPFLAKSDRVGELSFTPECDVPDTDWARFLLNECGEAFVRAEEVTATPAQASTPHVTKPKEDPLIYVGKRFSGKGGKWKAFAFIKRHHAEEILGIRRLKIFTKTIHWELCPIALADTGTADMPIPWNKPTEGPLKETDHEHRDDDRDSSLVEG